MIGATQLSLLNYNSILTVPNSHWVVARHDETESAGAIRKGGIINYQLPQSKGY